MGKLTYDSTMSVEFEDRVLAHLQLVIAAKLRRGEAFFFSWKDDPAAGDGRTSVWLHPTIPLSFKFYGSRQPAINRAWVESLMQAANSTHGLQIIPEPRQAGENGSHGGVE
ncbi:ATP-dependent DNA ligase [Herbiconiux moechotypicola]|uniref:DUF7882 domain-containing protein n=1 Tax=Herbiconiux moechotypicola TaxID=637393 RepID=A0ABP5R3A7_9MICO|nr:ATP-dependent DNA ligase [Herbiconiux moechotypicola]MCS5730731.1 ATP-dependent DNA ligase [Herbiconiux moechotypicola]